MATSSRTTNWAFPVLATASNNTLTSFSPIVVYIPESGVVIDRAWVDISFDDIVTSTGGSISLIRYEFGLDSIPPTGATSSTAIANSAENISLNVTRSFIVYFANNWSGPTMSCSLSVQINQTTGVTLGMVNLCAILNVTYKYDITSATQSKSVWIPLNAPRTSLPAVKTSHDTIPVLDTYLPESGKAYRNIFIVTYANRHHVNATDYTVTYELSSLGTHITQIYEAALLTDVFTRYVWDITSYITTNTTHTFNVWSSLASRHNAPIFYMVVTYEFDPSTTTQVMNCQILPAEFDSPFGGTTAADYQRSSRDLWIPEPNPTINRIACLVHWNSAGNEAGLNARVGTGNFLAYTITGSSVIAGEKCMMIRNDNPSGLTFSRGRNTLSVDIYNTSATERGLNIGCLWLVNYTSNLSPTGIHTHMKTIQWINTTQTTFAQQVISTPTPFVFPEPNWFVGALGYEFKFINSATALQGITIGVERLASEGGIYWEPAYADAGGTDLEVGWNIKYSQTRGIFRRWSGDYDQKRLDISVSRRIRSWAPNANVIIHDSLTSLITYHSIVGTVSGTISGSDGATVSIYLQRANTGEIVLSDSRVGDGTYSFTWFDDTENILVLAHESNTKKGISKIDLMGSGDFDISLSSGGGGGEYSYTWFG
jgi:hypothetical protein